jgi:hypothetical protein
MARRAFAAASAASLVSLHLGAQARAGDAKTLRFIMRNDLRLLEPMWTTAYVTRNCGYMILDTLLALDEKFQPPPHMVGDVFDPPEGTGLGRPRRMALCSGIFDCCNRARRWRGRLVGDAQPRSRSGACRSAFTPRGCG